MSATPTNSATTLENRLRQVAVLVASVDTTAARQVLMNLPTEIAKRVRAMAADIGPIPPEERRALLAEFQKSQAQLRSTGTPSDSQRERQESTAQAFSEYSQANLQPGFQPASTSESAINSDSGPSWTRLSIDTLVRLVRTERPTVIAVVLQQIPAAQAAAVLQRLPGAITRQVLQTLGSMQDIDDEAMEAIDDYLSQRLRDYHHKIETELEQSRRMNELLAAAPVELKQQWASWLHPASDTTEPRSAGKPASATASALNTLDRLYQSASISTADAPWIMDGQPATQQFHPRSSHPPTASQTSHPWPELAPQITSVSPPGYSHPTTANPVSPHQLNRDPATNTEKTEALNKPTTGKTTNGTAKGNSKAESPSSRLEDTVDDTPITIPFPGPRAAKESATAEPISAAARKHLHVRMDQLLKLDPESLAQLLSSLDSHTVLLSLAGASPKFIKRFSNMLEPEDAKVLAEKINRIGNVSLREIDGAQLRLIAAYDSWKAGDASNRGHSDMPLNKRAA